VSRSHGRTVAVQRSALREPSRRSATRTPAAWSHACPPTTSRDRSRSRPAAGSSPYVRSMDGCSCGPRATGAP